MKTHLHRLLFLLLFFMLSSNSYKHEYYVSVTKLEYVKEKKAIQIISQIFIDDFEKVLRERYDNTITLAEKNEPKVIKKYMEKYLQNKLKIKVNTQDIDFNFLGKEYKDDIVYCYLEIENVKRIKSLEITNEVLFDIYPEQQNIVRTKVNGKDKSFILISEKKKALLNFK